MFIKSRKDFINFCQLTHNINVYLLLLTSLNIVLGTLFACVTWKNVFGHHLMIFFLQLIVFLPLMSQFFSQACHPLIDIILINTREGTSSLTSR